MRSTAFALLGLTAAAALAMVALFAAPGFPLLGPAPLPSEPPARQAVAAARKLAPVRHRTAVAAPVARHQAPQPGTSAPSAGATPVSEATGGVSGPDPVQPAAATSPAAGPGHHEGKTGGDGATETPSATSTPVSTPQPSPPPPEAVISTQPPEAAPAPGNSSSPAAAEHASERGIEASSGTGPPGSAGQAGGYAKGQGK